MQEPGYFLLGDSLNTTVTVIATLQNEIVAYNFLQLTYLLIVGIVAQAVGIFVYWRIQKRYQLPTKTMFNAVAVGIILLDAWGMIGIWTQRFGFHNKWEVWVSYTSSAPRTPANHGSPCLQLYQVFYGLFVCPWYSYSQTVSFNLLLYKPPAPPLISPPPLPQSLRQRRNTKPSSRRLMLLPAVNATRHFRSAPTRVAVCSRYPKPLARARPRGH